MVTQRKVDTKKRSWKACSFSAEEMVACAESKGGVGSVKKFEMCGKDFEE